MSKKKLHLLHFSNEKSEECFVFLWGLKEIEQTIQNYASQKTKIDFSKYGEIILHGIGKPSSEAIEEMRDIYGYNE